MTVIRITTITPRTEEQDGNSSQFRLSSNYQGNKLLSTTVTELAHSVLHNTLMTLSR